MADYHSFPYTGGVSASALTLALRASDPTAGVGTIENGSAKVKSDTAWSPARISAAQAILNTAVELTPQARAQLQVDAMPLEWKALALALIDQLNVIRAALPTPLGPISSAQALAAIRAKAGTL